MPKVRKDGLQDVAQTEDITLDTSFDVDPEVGDSPAAEEDAIEEDSELVRIQEVFNELVKLSSTVNYEKVSTHSLDGESFITLRLDPKAFEAMRKILITLRTEYQLTLV